MDSWTECGHGSGVWWRGVEHKGFGPVSVILLELAPGQLALVSAPKSATEVDFREIEMLGQVTALIAPNIAHVSGLTLWSARYPGALCYGPDDQLEALERLARRAFKAVSSVRAEPGLEFHPAPDTRSGALWIKSTRGDSPVVYLDELVISMTARPVGLASRIAYWLTGTRPGLGINQAFTKILCRDAKALARAALDFTEDASMILPAHGAPISGDEDIKAVRQALRSYGR